MKTIIEMAQEAGGYLAELPNGDAWLFDDAEQIKRFAALVRADEREACARIADSMDPLQDGAIAFVIRARGNT